MSMAIRNGRSMRKKDTLWHQVRINRASYLLMAPYFTLFFLFTVLPVLMSVYLSFNYFNMLEMPRWVGFCWRMIFSSSPCGIPCYSPW